jgi:predicted nucleotidyltransferase component of viral defense system
MTSKGQITKIASKDGVDARVVERDYVLVHVVALISAHDTDRTLVFKGGTSLRLSEASAFRRVSLLGGPRLLSHQWRRREGA